MRLKNQYSLWITEQYKHLKSKKAHFEILNAKINKDLFMKLYQLLQEPNMYDGRCLQMSE